MMELKDRDVRTLAADSIDFQAALYKARDERDDLRERIELMIDQMEIDGHKGLARMERMGCDWLNAAEPAAAPEER